MDSEKRLLLALVLSLAVYWLFQAFLAPPPPKAPPKAPPAVTSAEPVPAGTQGPADGVPVAVPPPTGDVLPEPTLVPPAPAVPPRVDEVRRDTFAATFTNVGAGPSDWHLTRYQEAAKGHWIFAWAWDCVTDDCGPSPLACGEQRDIDLIHQTDGSGIRAWFGGGDAPPPALLADEVVGTPTGDEIVYRRQEGSLLVTTAWRLPSASTEQGQGYLAPVQVTVENRGGSAARLQPRFAVVDAIAPPEGGQYEVVRQVYASLGGDIDTWATSSLDKKGKQSAQGQGYWAGIADNYFLSALVPMGKDLPAALHVGGLPASPRPEAGPPVGRYYATLAWADEVLAPGQRRTFELAAYMGPKDLEVLKTLGHGLPEAVDYGWVGAIARPMLWLLRALHGFSGSWGLAIILLTVIVKLAVFPLDQSAYRGMKAMQELQPKMRELQERYKENREQLNLEVMKLYQENKVNPIGGCLPMLIQMPIWFALYRVLWNSIELYNSKFLYFCDLSQKDPVALLPTLLLGAMVLQMQMNPPPPDETQRRVMQIMTVGFGLLMFTMPAGLVLYILVSTILRMGQQWMVQRSSPAKATA